MAVQFVCESDGKSFDKKNKLELHMKTHEEKKLACIMCNDKFATQSGLGTHKMNVHSGKKFSCEKCKKI